MGMDGQEVRDQRPGGSEVSGNVTHNGHAHNSLRTANADRERAAPPRPAPDISPREWNLIGERLGIPDRQVEIMELFVARIWKPKDIAAALCIRVCTAKTHIQRMYKHLQVHSRSEAVVLALLALLEIRHPSGK